MRSSKRPVRIKRVLDLCDRWGGLRTKINEERHDDDPRELRPLQQRSRRMQRELALDLKAGRLPGTVGRLAAQHALSSDEVLILLTLLKRRITQGSAAVPGREILRLLFDSSYEMLRGSALLARGGRLRASGVVVTDREGAWREHEDVFETGFKLAEPVFRAINVEIVADAGLAPDRASLARPYRDHKDYLLDLRRLSVLHQRRANRLYKFDYWQDPEAGGDESPEFLTSEIERAKARIRESLRATEGAESFPFVRFQREHGLDDREVVIVVTLLFQETFFGHSHHEVVELLKLVSGSERELLDNRAILGRSSRLVRREIVSIDFPAGERELVAEASLAAWTHEKMLFDTGDQRAPLDAKARRDFLDFLNSLRGSDEFYRGLEDGR
jgi:hypothetical protein